MIFYADNGHDLVLLAMVMVEKEDWVSKTLTLIIVIIIKN